MVLSCRLLIVRQGEDGEAPKAQRACSSPTMLCGEVQPLFLTVSDLSTIRHRSGALVRLGFSKLGAADGVLIQQPPGCTLAESGTASRQARSQGTPS